jgi:hypothetical protein
MSKSDIHGAFGLEFSEQVEFFRKKLNLPTARWDDIRRAAHDTSFVVAGAMKADLLADLNRAVEKAIAKGTGLKAFREDFKKIVEARGWHGWTGEGTKAGEAWRTRVIWETNLATSYAAGRNAQLTDPDLLARRPYWKYVHADGVMNPRPQHLAWNGLVLRHDHPFWQTHSPPNGWGCHCRIVAVRAPAEGDPTEPPDGWNQRDAKGNLPGIDKNWDYAPGASVSNDIRRIVEEKLSTLDATLGAAFGAAVAPTIDKVTDARFAEFFDLALKNRARPTGSMMMVGAMKPDWVKEMTEAGVKPATAEMVIRDNDIAHIFRDAKNTPLSPDFFRGLPTHLKTPLAVILDTTHTSPALLIVLDDAPNKAKIMVQIDYLLKKPKYGLFNIVNTGRAMDNEAFETLRRETGKAGRGLILLEGKL